MNKRNKILVGCLALLLALSVGYALFSETVTINGTATAKGDFDIGVTCQTGLADVGGLYDNAFNALSGQETENSYSNDSCTVDGNAISFTTNLNAPGAMRYYTIKATNNGTIDAWAPVTDNGTGTTQACMGEEMLEIVGRTSSESCHTKLFDSGDAQLSSNSEGSYNFEDFSFAYIIEKTDGTLIDLYQLPEEEAITYLSDDGEQVKLPSGYSLYYVGKMYIPSDYKYSSDVNMIDFNLSADYTLDFVQQANE